MNRKLKRRDAHASLGHVQHGATWDPAWRVIGTKNIEATNESVCLKFRIEPAVPRVEPRWSLTWAEVAPKWVQLGAWGQVAACWTRVGSKLGRSWGLVDPKWRCYSQVGSKRRLWTMLGRYAKCANYIKLPQTRAVHFLAACSVRKFPLAETVPVEQICSYSHPSLLNYHALAPSARADWVIWSTRARRQQSPSSGLRAPEGGLGCRTAWLVPQNHGFCHGKWWVDEDHGFLLANVKFW